MTGRAVLSLLVLLAHANAQEKLRLRFFHDKNDQELVLRDVHFLTNQRALAFGVLFENDKPKGVQLVSGDGGAHWAIEPIREIPRAVHFINDSLGWMVTEGGIWQSEEAGRQWKKIKSQKGLLGVHFVDADHGFVIGTPKLVMRTVDGGKKWTPVPEAATPETKPENSVYSTIGFADAKRGIIAGYSVPPRPDDRNRRLPAWMESPQGRRRPQRPTVLLDLETRNGGETWQPQSTAIFGRPTRLALAPDGSGFIVFQFDDVFQWRSEVYRMKPPAKAVSVYREKTHLVTDVLRQKNGTVYLAVIDLVSDVPGVPIPGRVLLLRSIGEPYTLWERIPVDYRASANLVRLTETPEGEIWAITDQGMILSLGK